MHRKFGKKDVIFIGALLGICLIVLGVWYFAGRKQGASVVVTREGEVYGTYSLSQPQTVKIKNSKGKTTNVLVIRDGKADMKEACGSDRNEFEKRRDGWICTVNSFGEKRRLWECFSHLP